MRTRLPVCLLLAALAWGADLDTARAAEPGADSRRPRIGLVLAGGGAKGGAHVGVLKVLEQLRIPVDCIAGTSMGALIGAGYASGIPAAGIEQFLLDIRWQAVIGNAGRRDLEPIEQKRTSATYTNELELGLRAGRLVMPAGVVDTARIENLLRNYVAQARLLTNFDALPIPFRAVATDMLRGEMVVLDSGDIATALRASMAIPGAFSPVELDGKVLADGGMVRNLPVDVARELCADVLIVSDLVEPEVRPEGLQSAFQMLMRSTDISIIANEREQLATLTADDVHIAVPTKDIGTAAFERIPETFALGEAAALEAASRLSRLSLPEAEYRAWRARTTAAPRRQVKLAGVRFEGLRHVNPEFLEARARLREGDVVDIDQISEEALRLAALRDFDTVGYRLVGDPAHPVLEWLPIEKTITPHSLRFDFGTYSSTGGDLAFQLYSGYTRSWLNRLGGEWHSELQLGYENHLGTRLYQPLDTAHRWFIEPGLRLQQTTEDFYERGDRIGRYKLRDYGGGLDLGYNFGNHAQLRVGVDYQHRAFDVDTGPAQYPEGTRNDAGLVASFTWDTRDSRINATRGLAAVVEYMRAEPSLGSDTAWQRAEFALGSAVPVGSNVLWTTLAAGSDLGSTLAPDRMFTLGGPRSLPGYELGELRSGDYWSVGGSYLHKLADILTLQGQALYVGVGAQLARVYEAFDEPRDGAIWGSSLYLTGRTPLGPATLGFGITTRDSWSLWLGIGRPIGHGTLLDRGILR